MVGERKEEEETNVNRERKMGKKESVNGQNYPNVINKKCHVRGV